jgi:hypothetical protein
VTLAADEQPVEALGPGGADEPLGKRVRARRSNRRADDARADRGHHVVEGSHELGVTIPDEEPNDVVLVLESCGEVACLLGDPAPGRMCSHAGEEHLASVEVDEEQHIEPAKRNGVDREEVTGERAGSLCSKELRPRGPRSSRCRPETVTPQDVAHARRGDNDTELCALADDAEIAPAGVLLRQPDDEGDDLLIESIGRNLAAARVRPVPRDELPVPAKKRRWRDEEARPALTGQKPSQRGEHGAVGGGVSGTCHLAPQHRELMTKHGDLDVLLVRCRAESQEVEQSPDEQEGDRTAHRISVAEA